jgi:hypothetical protein
MARPNGVVTLRATYSHIKILSNLFTQCIEVFHSIFTIIIISKDYLLVGLCTTEAVYFLFCEVGTKHLNIIQVIHLFNKTKVYDPELTTWS